MTPETIEVIAAALAGEPGALPNAVGLLYTTDPEPGTFVLPTDMATAAQLLSDIGGNLALCRFNAPPARTGSAVAYRAATSDVFEYVYPAGQDNYAETFEALSESATPAYLLAVVVLSRRDGGYYPLIFTSLRNTDGSYPAKQPGVENFIVSEINLGTIG